MIQSSFIAKSLFWAMFIVITLAGLNAFFVFPIQVGYGQKETIFFKIETLMILSLFGFRFFYDMDRSNSFNKSR